MYRKFFKRVIDIILSFMGIVVLGLPMLIIAIVVKCDSKGPAIFVQDRVGKNRKIFRFYKFRSMRTEAPKEVATRNLHSDSYITKAGAFLRRSSLDELPQLFNILKGQMSIIGPRPVVITEYDLIEKREQVGAYKVKPGLTGLAQISGRDKLIDMDKKANLDGKYASNINFLNDVGIFFKTIFQILKHDGVVEGEQVVELKNSEVAASEDMYEQIKDEVITKANSENEPINDIVASTAEEENELKALEARDAVEEKEPVDSEKNLSKIDTKAVTIVNELSSQTTRSAVHTA